MVVTKEKKSEYNRRYREKQALKQENEIKEPKKETKKETKKKDKEIKIETVSPSFLSKYGSYLLPAVLPLVKGIFFYTCKTGNN